MSVAFSDRPQNLRSAPNWDNNPIFDVRRRGDIPNATQTSAGQVIIDEAQRQARYSSTLSGGALGAMAGGIGSILINDAYKKPDGSTVLSSNSILRTIAAMATTGAAIGYIVGPILARSSAKSKLAHAELGIFDAQSVYGGNYGGNNVRSAVNDAMTYKLANDAIKGFGRK